MEKNNNTSKYVSIAVTAIGIALTALLGLSLFLLTQVFSLNSQLSSVSTADVERRLQVIEMDVSQLGQALTTITHRSWTPEQAAGMAGQFVEPVANEAKSHGQVLRIRVTANGVEPPTTLWVLVHPFGWEGYWPVAGPLAIRDGEEWEGEVYLGRETPGADLGQYLLLLVAADSLTTREFIEYHALHEEDYPGMALPPGALFLDSRIVERVS